MMESPASVIIAIINTAGLIIVAGLQLLAGRRTKAIKHQVQNDHSSNLRNDVDWLISNVKLVLLKTSRTADIQETQAHDIRGLRAEIGQIRKIEREQWAAIDENTNPRRKHHE